MVCANELIRFDGNANSMEAFGRITPWTSAGSLRPLGMMQQNGRRAWMPSTTITGLWGEASDQCDAGDRGERYVAVCPPILWWWQHLIKSICSVCILMCIVYITIAWTRIRHEYYITKVVRPPQKLPFPGGPQNQLIFWTQIPHSGPMAQKEGLKNGHQFPAKT